MDAIELARQVAERLHTQAVANGHDPWEPFAFARAEAERRGLDVEVAARGAAVLDGGRAVYIARDSLILHEDAGTPFERAFLIAHEIGHAELGDAADSTAAREIDPARPVEASPVGLDRVVDYGRKQRREVQMDLFAREFLLPRSVVRRLHLEEELSATVIAERLGAPFAVVAQQVFDALLLPVIELPSAGESAERDLNPEQIAAAEYRGCAYLLEAGPGTGKTQTLLSRIEGLLTDGIDPCRILVLTFSNKAAREMAERIAAKNKDAAAAMWIGTFHAFGLDLIRRFHLELGLPKDPRLMDRAEAVDRLEALFPGLGLVHYANLSDPTQIIADMLAAISRAKDEVVDAKRYAELADNMKQAGGAEAAERVAEVALVYERYEKLKRDAHCVDFGDLVSMPVRLLETNDAIRTHLQAEYDHVLVDEYQDVNRSSVRLLEGLRPDGKNLWVVGDAKQSIYRFRGASSFNMTRFGTEDFPGGQRGRLKLNYRSVTEIVDAFSAFASKMKAGGGKGSLTAERGPGGHSPQHRAVTTPPQQTVALADAIEEMRAGGFRYRDQAVLCTGNEKLSAIGQELERLDIPVLFLGSLFERDEVKDLLALLSVLIDRRAMGLTRVACSTEFKMSLGDVGSVLDYLRTNESAPMAWLSALAGIPGLSSDGAATLRRMAAALAGFGADAGPWTVLATLLLERTRIAARLAAATDVIDRGRCIALWQFLNFVRAQPSGRGLPIMRLLEGVRRLVRLGDERDLRQLPAAAQGIDAVRLMTIHGAKGLEFRVVHLPGMNADTLPRKPPAPPCPLPDGIVEGATGSALDVFHEGQTEEQECLFYVALSRARDRLFLYCPTQKVDGKSRAASPFLARMGSGLARQQATLTRALPQAPQDRAIAWTYEGKLSFTGQQMALYESCPRRFFYTHVLQVGGRRSMTDFMRMHEAVRAVSEAMIAATVSDGDLETLVARAFEVQGLDAHEHASAFRTLAVTMIRFFAGTREGLTPEPPTALRLAFGDHDIIVRPDEVLLEPGGRRILRRMRTGHRRSDEEDDLGAAAFVLAARQAFPDALVQLVHLADQEVFPISLTPRQLENRRKKLDNFLSDIRAGHFPIDPSPRTCPGCPAFFICACSPDGTLRKKF
jgi:superfamily I DNA/RNA helicase/Zn-dependent peptidase ImmA (M78 family)